MTPSEADQAKRIPTVDELRKVSAEQFQADRDRILAEAKHGTQVTIVDSNGKIQTVVGMNGIRILGDPPTEDDPIAALERLRAGS